MSKLVFAVTFRHGAKHGEKHSPEGGKMVAITPSAGTAETAAGVREVEAQKACLKVCRECEFRRPCPEAGPQAIGCRKLGCWDKLRARIHAGVCPAGKW